MERRMTEVKKKKRDHKVLVFKREEATVCFALTVLFNLILTVHFILNLRGYIFIL